MPSTERIAVDSFIECVGDPRAMGLCQGLALRAAVRDCVAAVGGTTRRSRFPTLRALTSGSVLGGGMGREAIRHYTHLAERMAGIARNADIPFDSLVELFVRETSAPEPDAELVSTAVAVALAGREAVNPIVMRTLAGDSWSNSPWILRRSRPEVGFVSVEVTLPWLASAVAGINEAGVAVAVAPRSASYGGGVNAGAVGPRRAPHAVLLVQECLQRFEDLDGCLDWCQKRPRSGNTSLIVADAGGRLARVEVEGTDCLVVDVDQPFALDGAPPAVDASLRAGLRDEHRIDLEALSQIGPSNGRLAVWLEPASRRLSLRSLEDDTGTGKVIETLNVS